jgi:hypothetical protein
MLGPCVNLPVTWDSQRISAKTSRPVTRDGRIDWNGTVSPWCSIATSPVPVKSGMSLVVSKLSLPESNSSWSEDSEPEDKSTSDVASSESLMSVCLLECSCGTISSLKDKWGLSQRQGAKRKHTRMQAVNYVALQWLKVLVGVPSISVYMWNDASPTSFVKQPAPRLILLYYRDGQKEQQRDGVWKNVFVHCTSRLCLQRMDREDR